MKFNIFSAFKRRTGDNRAYYSDYVNLAYKRFNDFFGISNYKYADAVVMSILDPFFVALKNTQWYSLGNSSSELFAKFDLFVKKHSEDVFFLMFKNGYVNVYDEDDIFNISKNYEHRQDKPIYTFLHTDYRHTGKSTEELLKPFLTYLDNILNAANTSVKRLGVMAFLMPKVDAYGNGLTEKELKKAEEDLQNSYGILDSQRIVKITSHDYTLSTLNIGGANMQFDSRLQSVIKIISGKIGVPYELVSAAIIGNPNQTGVYQSEALKRLYISVKRYCEFFVNFAESLGLQVSYENLDAPKAYEQDDAVLNEKTLKNIHDAETYGYLSHDEAVEQYNLTIGKL